jgi:uncharacterized protein (DUF885 family)
MVTTKRRGPLVAFGWLAAMAAGWAVAASAAEGDAASRLGALIDREWEQRFADDPVFATMNGRHDRDHLLSEVTVAEFERQTNDTRAFLEELAAIDRAALPESEQVNYDLFQWQLQSRIEEFEVGHWRMPINSDSGFHTEFPRLAGALRFASAKDYENYIARLRALPRMFDQFTALMRDGMAKGMTVPRVVLENYDVTISSHVVDEAAKSLFYKPFEKFPAAVGAADQERLRKEAADAILGSVVPAYRKFSEFMAKEYIPAARTTIGASDMPGGKDYYAQRIRIFTTLDLSADQIHQIGLDEVARIRKEMDAIIARVGFKGTFAEFLAFLRTDPRFYAKTPHELLAAASFHAKKMDGKLPSLFKTLPRLPYGVEPVPDYLAPVYTGGRYSPAAPGSTQSGNYWVNTYALDKRPLYTLEALTLHEAVPGHHLQIALAQELQDVPEFRRDIYISAFGEGWGLYSERLGLEAGFYTDPYSDFGRLTYEMWRAARLVVDTGMHAKGWTRQQALDFLGQNTALSLHEVRTEIDRYIAWPGQALSYKLGELHIRSLRAKAEKELGAKFDIREFHDQLLKNGAVPLPVLTRVIDRYIAEHK